MKQLPPGAAAVGSLKIKIHFFGLAEQFEMMIMHLNCWLKFSLLLCFNVDGICGISDVVQLHCPGQDGSMAFSSGVDCHLLHLH